MGAVSGKYEVATPLRIDGKSWLGEIEPSTDQTGCSGPKGTNPNKVGAVSRAADYQ